MSGPLLIPRGLHASYFANASWQGPPERGLYGSWPSETRIDSSVAFGDGLRDLPLYFLNDSRFNRPGATSQPLSIEWTGNLLVPVSDADLQVYLSGRGVAAETFIDGFLVDALNPTETEAMGRVRIRPGVRRLDVKVTSPSGVPEAFQAGVVDSSSGRRRPFGSREVLQRPASPARVQFDRFLRALTVIGDVAALAVLAIVGFLAVRQATEKASTAGWRENLMRALPLFAFAQALSFAQHSWNRFIFLGWGTDRLTYESLSRDIVFHGPLMTLGAPVGQGAPYYFQPLYPYFLSVVHLVTGEGLWGVYLCQGLLLAVIFHAMWSIADVLFDAPTAAATAVLAFWFAFVRLHDLSASLYTESVFVPLICLWTLWLCREAVRPGTRSLTVGATLGGLGALARSTLLAAWPPVAFVFSLVYAQHRELTRRLVVLFVLLASVVSLATVRNWIVAGRFVPVTSSLATNILAGNSPPRSRAPNDERHLWMDWLARDVESRAVLEYAYHAPGEFVKGLMVKAAYVLGLESIFGVKRPVAFATTVGISWTLPWIWVSALLGGVLLLRRGSRQRTATLPQLVPAIVSLSQFAAVILIFPYSERLVTPFYALILPYAAVPFGVLARRFGRTSLTNVEY